MTTINTSNPTSLYGDNSSQPSAAQTAATDQSFQELIGANDDPDADAKQMLADITANGSAGYITWQLKQLREKAAAEVMASMNLTADKIAAMGTKERVATEQKIEQIVEQKIKQEIADESKKKQQQALVTSASMHSIITNAQSIKDKIQKSDTAVTPSNPADVTDLLLFGAS